MATQLDATEIQAARNIADQVKAGQTKEVGLNLADQFLSMNDDRGKFATFMTQVKADNVQDQKTNKYLPGVEFGEQLLGNYTVDVTTPGKLFGNVWRNSQEVFADVKNTDDSYLGLDGSKYNQETAIVEGKSEVTAEGNILVIGLAGAKVHAQSNASVLACYGSWVEADGTGPVIATKGATVLAHQDSKVAAESGSVVEAFPGSHVTANDHSLVIAHDSAQVDAQSGSQVVVDGSPQVTQQSGAQVITWDDFVKAHPASSK